MDPVLQRAMFSGQAPQVPQAAGTGITSGLETTPEQEAEMESTLAEIAGGLQSMNDDIDNAEDYVGIMNAIRGDDQSIDQRRSELAGYIGKEDAGKTPESALTLIQPSLTLLDSAEQGSQEEGGAIADDGIMSMLGELGGQGAMQGAADAMQGGQPMQAPGQGEAMARMAMGEQPVMRQSGSSAEGETTFPSGMNLATLKTLQGLVPQATTYDQNLKYYKDVLGSDKTGYELNPYIAGLNLAAAVANAPEGGLLTSVLAPETIKAVSDPILQMAQAKSKTEQAVKLKAAEATAASKATKAKAESDLLLKVAPDLLKIPDLKTFGDATIGYYAVDPANPSTPITLREGLGRKKDIFGNKTSGYGYLDDNNKYVSVVTGQGESPKIFGDSEFGYFYLDDKEAVQTAKAGTGKADKIFGNATTGYFAYDTEAKSATKIEGAEGTGVQPPEFIALMDRYNSASAIVNNTQSSSADIAKAKNEMGFLSDKLTTKDPEFTTLMNTKADLIYNQTAGTDKVKAEARDAYVAKSIDAFIRGKTTVAANYNPNEALDKTFSEMFGKQITEIQEGSAQADKLAGMSDMAVIAGQNFTPGAFAQTRLQVTKMMDAVGGREAVKTLLGENRYNSFFGADGSTRNDVASGDVLEAIGSQFAISFAASFPGNLNESEVKLIKDAGPSLMKSQKGMELLSKIFNSGAARTKLEAEYATEFNLDQANKNLGARELHAKFNQGLREIRTANPLLSDDLKSQISGVVSDETTIPDGALSVKDINGNSGYIPVDQVGGYNAVKQSPDRNTFIANFAQLQATNPGLANLDAGTFYDSMINLNKVAP